MSVLLCLWLTLFFHPIGTYCGSFEKIDNSAENSQTIDRSDNFKYTPKKSSYKSNYEKKYHLRFDPSSLKQISNYPLPNYPSTGYPSFNLEDLSEDNLNFLQGLQNNALNNSFLQNIPNVPSVPSLENNINNTLLSGSNNDLPSTLLNNGYDPSIIPISLLNQTNPLLNNPIGAGRPEIGLQTLRPGIRPGSLPTLPNSFMNNVPIQPIIATMPRPGFSTSLAYPVTRPQGLQGMFSVIGDRVKNLFSGIGPTLIKRPSGSRGFLNLFDVIKFENGPCIGSLNRIRLVNGTCFYKSECVQKGGFIAGSCAGGYGVCCIFRYSCGAQTEQEITYLENPNYPLASTEPLTCAFVVHLQPGVHQVKLDLLFFELKRPSAGNCLDDQFVVSGQNRNFFVPILCGINSGQHMYIDVDRSLERKLELSIVGRSAGARAFSIRISQLRYNLVPRYCLQYFNEPTGYIKSFNYDTIGSVVEDRIAGYFNNLNYAICIDRAPDKCDVTFTNEVAEGEQQFQIINVNEQGLPLIPPNQAGADVFSCPGDFIAFNSLRLCGGKLNDGSVSQNFFVNAPITEYSTGPVVIAVQSDETVVGRGFKLMYYQESCL